MLWEIPGLPSAKRGVCVRACVRACYLCILERTVFIVLLLIETITGCQNFSLPITERLGGMSLIHPYPVLSKVRRGYVYWTVHHLHSWIKRDQLDVTCFFISLFTAQHVSDVNTSILRSLRLICWVISWVVLLWFDVCWCYVVVWLGWCGIRMQAEALVLDVTSFTISLFNAQHISDVNTSILRSLRLIFFSYFMGCIALVRCVLVSRCGLAGVVWCRIRLKPASGYHTTCSTYFTVTTAWLAYKCFEIDFN